MIPRLGHIPADQHFPLPNNVNKFGPHASGIAARAIAALDLKGPTRRTHNDVIDRNIGWKIDPEKWATRSKASQTLAEQSEHMADALERMGIPSRLDSNITVIGAVSGIAESVPMYRAIRFIPSVAARDRRPYLNGLKYYMETRPESRYYRYAVFTAPEPVPFGGAMREAVRSLSRRISKWAPKAREHGVEVLYRGIEYTRATAAERDAEAAARGKPSNLSEHYGPDTVLYHVHANVITWPKRAMTDADWSSFLSMTWKTVKAHWKDNGRIQKPEEIIKYCLKPADLNNASDEELAWLYHETKRLKITQPLGPFAAFMAELKEAGDKIVRVRIGSHSASRLSKVKKSPRLGGDRQTDENETPESDSMPSHEAADTVRDTPSSEIESQPKTTTPPTNMILGISLPQWKHMPWAEPMILVQRYDPQTANRASRERLDELEVEKRIIRDKWDASGAPDPKEALRIAEQALSAGGGADRYKVHTCSSTVPEPSEAKAAGGLATCRFSRSSHAPPESEHDRRLRLLFTFDEYDDLIPDDGPPLYPTVAHAREMLEQRATEDAIAA